MEYCTDVEVNEYCNCTYFRRDNTNKTKDTAIPKLKEVLNTKTLSSYISFKNADRKMEYCTDVEVNEYYNCTYYRRDNTIKTKDTAIPNLKEVLNTKTLSPYISFKNADRKMEYCTDVEVNDYYNCTYFRRDNTNKTKDTAIPNLKELQKTKTLSPYISFKNADRKMEYCTDVEVNEYYNCTYFRRDNTNKTKDTAIPKLKEVRKTKTLSPYISFKNADRKMEYCTDVEVNEYYNCTYFRRDNTNKVKDTAIPNLKEVQKTKTLSPYISFKNDDRKMEYCTDVEEVLNTKTLSPYISFKNADRNMEYCTDIEVNKQYNITYFRRDNTNKTKDTAIPNLKEVQKNKILSPYISFKNDDRNMGYCTDVKVNEDNTNKVKDTAIPKLKEVQKTKTLSPYISFKNADRKMEYCTDVEVNEDNTNKTKDTAIPNLKEVLNTETLSPYISFKNDDRNMGYCTDVKVNEYCNCTYFLRDNTIKTKDTAIPNLKEVLNTKTLSPYISFKNADRKMEYCTDIEVYAVTTTPAATFTATAATSTATIATVATTLQLLPLLLLHQKLLPQLLLLATILQLLLPLLLRQLLLQLLHSTAMASATATAAALNCCGYCYPYGCCTELLWLLRQLLATAATTATATAATIAYYCCCYCHCNRCNCEHCWLLLQHLLLLPLQPLQLLQLLRPMLVYAATTATATATTATAASATAAIAATAETTAATAIATDATATTATATFIAATATATSAAGTATATSAAATATTSPATATATTATATGTPTATVTIFNIRIILFE
uniref:Uncharacterized protein n=1 Tax=Rhodnius prolixus TaxID=13249 RepID=T1I3W5_RHOPR